MFSLVCYFAVTEVWDDNADSNSALYWQLQLAGNMLLWTTLYLVKASFLALIWTIFKVSAGFRRAWWAVTTFTFLTFWPIVLSEFWHCGGPSEYASAQTCNSFPTNSLAEASMIYLRFAFHITTDCFILILPIAQIRKAHMPLTKKINIAAVFALTILDILFGVIRNVGIIVAMDTTPTQSGGDDLDIIGQVIEPAIAVFVCALPPYRALVVKLRSRKNNHLELQHDVPTIRARRRRLPRPFHLLSLNIPSPMLSVSILREHPQQSVSHYSTSSIEMSELPRIANPRKRESGERNS